LAASPVIRLDAAQILCFPTAHPLVAVADRSGGP
jgi:hypothetical protein